MSRHLFASKTIGSELCRRFLPVMVTRLLLSLKKAVATQERGWKLGEPTTHTTMRFAEHRGGASAGDEIHLDTLASAPEETQSQE